MWGYGLLGYRDESFLQKELGDFINLVNGANRWQLEIEDRLFEQLSYFNAHSMLSTGNYNKNTKPEKLARTTYLPLEERLKKADNRIKNIGEQAVNAERERLRAVFNITE